MYLFKDGETAMYLLQYVLELWLILLIPQNSVLLIQYKLLTKSV